MTSEEKVNYTLTAKDPKQQDLGVYSGGLLWGSTLGVYSGRLLWESLGQPILDLETHSPSSRSDIWNPKRKRCLRENHNNTNNNNNSNSNNNNNNGSSNLNKNNNKNTYGQMVVDHEGVSQAPK